VAHPPSIPDEISVFLNRNAEILDDLPQIINIAFSGERKPEAWNVRLRNKQVSRGFNKSAPVTIMLALKAWRKLMKKNDDKLWQKAVADGHIQVHGDPESTNSILQLFGTNGNTHNEDETQTEPQQDSSTAKKRKTGKTAKTKKVAVTRKKKAQPASPEVE
jgi:hypothetical protein